ncbi:hypothetical protein LCGC14_1340760 [marine sediment metagenome]|uniref:Uncharacterized protein n=1 Tax=marine sediment metagenome TaxID=412755 RepID=A0A0F9KEK2_9ZZZZ
MGFHIDKQIMIDGRDADILPLIFTFAQKYMKEIYEKNPGYSSEQFDDVNNTIEKLMSVEEMEHRVENIKS